MYDKIELNEKALMVMKFEIMKLERENAKTKEKSDSDMIKLIENKIRKVAKEYDY